jgi:serine/threonine protein kinase
VSINAATLQGWFKEELRIERRFEKRGKISIFIASVGGGEELLFVIEAKDILNTHRELEKVLALRKEMHFPYLAPIAQYGFLSNGAFYWSYDLGSSSSFQNLFEEWPQNPLRLMRLISHAVGAIRIIHESGYFHGDLHARNLWLQLRKDGSENLLVVGENIGYWSDKLQLDSGDMSVDAAYCTAPEIAAGEVPGAPADIYALGVLLYRAVIGSWPFEGNNAWEITAAHATEPLRRPQTQPPLHEDLWGIIERSLEKDPSKRISIQDLAHALQLFANYEKPMFLDIEEFDIAEPSPQPSIAQTRAAKYKGKPKEANLSVSSLDFIPVPKRDAAYILSAEEEQLSAHFGQGVQPVKPSVKNDPPLVETLPEIPSVNAGLSTPSSMKKTTAAMVTIPDEEVSEDVTEQLKVSPLKILVGALPMPASISNEKTDEIENTEPMMSDQASWDEVEITQKQNDPSDVKTKEVTKIASGIETYQFIIFMLLSAVVTVLLLKIADVIF